MTNLDKGLEEIAKDMYLAVEGPYKQDDFVELVQNAYASMKEHYGDAWITISEEAILRVIRQQMMELIRFKRVHKLLKKRHNISGSK